MCKFVSHQDIVPLGILESTDPGVLELKLNRYGSTTYVEMGIGIQNKFVASPVGMLPLMSDARRLNHKSRDRPLAK